MMEHEIAWLHNYLTVGALLFGIGLIGFLSRRNLIVLFLAVEMMLQGVSLSLVAWCRFHNDGAFGGQMLVLFIIAVAACEAAVALALFLMLFRRRGTLDIAVWQQLREEDQPAYVDQQIPELPEPARTDWPKLPPAGVRPEADPERTDYRDHV